MNIDILKRLKEYDDLMSDGSSQTFLYRKICNEINAYEERSGECIIHSWDVNGNCMICEKRIEDEFPYLTTGDKYET